MLDGLLSGNQDAALPLRPLLKPWYRIAESDDGLLLEHGGAVVALGGHAARRLLPSLLPLLDGTRTAAEIVEQLDPRLEAAVENAVAVLGRHGLLTEGPPLDQDDAVLPTAHALATATGETPAVIAARLRASCVELAGPAAATEPLARLLLRSGVGVQPSGGDARLVVAAGLPADELGALNRDRHERGLPWLPVGSFDGRLAEIGPLVVPGETACAECVRIRRRATSGCAADHLLLAAARPVATMPPALATLVAALAADLALRWLGSADPTVPGALTTVTLDPGPTVAHRRVLRVPRCPVCSPVAGAAPASPWHEAAA